VAAPLDKEEEHENAQALADGHDEIMLAFLEDAGVR
jgi:hypothetical protein